MLKPADLGVVYLATPYSRFKGGINMAFQEAAMLAARMLAQGYKVYSPISHTHPIAIYGGIDPTSELWYAFDETMMGVSDTLVVGMMEGWEDSYGVKKEIEHFREQGKKIAYMDPETTEITRVE